MLCPSRLCLDLTLEKLTLMVSKILSLFRLTFDTFVLLVDESFESLERRATQAILSGPCDNIPQPTAVTFIDYEDPFSFFEEESDSPHMSRISQNAWVRCGDAIYVLDCLGKGHLRVEHVKGTEGEFHSLLRAAIG